MAYPNTSKFFCTSKFCVSTLSYIYIQTISNYHMAYPNDTHTIQSFTCMLTIFLPSHEIIITSSDTHTIESFTCSQSFCPRSHKITITSSDTHPLESFICSQSFCPHMK